MKKKKDYFFRAWSLLLVVMLALIALYFVPQEVLGWSPKPIDMLGDLRIEEVQPFEEDEQSEQKLSLKKQKENGQDSVSPQTQELQIQAERHKVYNSLTASLDSTTMPMTITDYSKGRIGLKHFFSQLARIEQMERPVHIAVLGDSFVEGDILTDAIRSALQQRWGGRGVGWLPMSSETAGFRQSIRHEFNSWQDQSMLHTAKKEKHLITGHIFLPKSGKTWSKYTLPKKEKPFNQVTLYYHSSEEVPIKITLSDSIETLVLPPSANQLNSYTISSNQEISSIRIDFEREETFACYGISLEGKQGVSVDNMSLRGNSGLLLGSVDEELNRAFNTHRPYDLIILQYGLNVANTNQKDYSFYGKQMKKVITRLRTLYPNADVMLLGVSDRAKRIAGQFSTMPEILKLHQQQQLIAQEMGIPFWSLLNAMKSLGGITEMAQRGEAAKDYTHLSHKGGRKLAEKFIEALTLEEKYYDAIKN
ncbi:hypothetical protein [Porphyromonas gingivicanis]|uniref:hypothetical protein n=1 Tax=Porphyromonas gingivicanis TaxID=266762 RepID=UPI000472775B|nr:hypothetical protein [Porphyromonas gingivicanis]